MERESMEFDVAIIGAGPSGLAFAIKLKQLCQQHQKDISICVLEKGSEVGAHILSGAVVDPKALNELLPDWQAQGAPLNTPATEDEFLFLTEQKSFSLPIPPALSNHGNYIISLANLCRWLAETAEAMEVEIFPGFPAAEPLFNDNDELIGVITGDMGIDKDGKPTAGHQPGIEIRAKATIFAEGCRGSVSKQLIEKYQLDKDAQAQTYGLGIKELWEVDPAKHKPGKVVHTIGWPLSHDTYGGAFLYHLEKNQVAVGFVTGLDYKNPYLSPFDEFQRFKHHPAIKDTFVDGQRISYGARALVEGGFQSLPKLTFPGGLLIGDSAGFLNVPKIKGTHMAMKSGMVAAEATFDHLIYGTANDYQTRIQNSWVWDELYQARNIRPGFNYGLKRGVLLAGIDAYLFRGKAPWTLKHHKPDHLATEPVQKYRPIDYPKPDGKISFDKLSSVYLSNTNHEENQPCHLSLKDDAVPHSVNLPTYDGLEQRYCPAGVYEYVEEEHQIRLQINAQNCVHCKTCDIKDPTQNIIWKTPEGSGGPNYPNM